MMYKRKCATCGDDFLAAPGQIYCCSTCEGKAVLEHEDMARKLLKSKKSKYDYDDLKGLRDEEN